MAEHWFCKPEVVGSNPTASFACRNECPDQAKRHAADDLKNVSQKRKEEPEFRCGRSPEPGLVICLGRWPSGQWHQTVNLAGLALRRFESCSAQSPAWLINFSGMENKLWVGKRGCSSMVEHRSSKPITRVRFPSPAWAQSPRTAVRGLADRCCSSAVERVLGKDEVLGSSPSSSSWQRIQIPLSF
jgi:hypothetical protein